MGHDLLHEALIQSDRGWHSLPGLLAAMARGEVGGFPALRPHQRPAWHMFLVQLSVMALDAAGQRELPVVEADWRTALRMLTPDYPEDEPWQLVGADRSRPAFLQPADPGGLKWSEVATPDALDMLITSRNHDVKREIARQAAPQDWIFALVSLQTMEGYQLKYSGIVRMKSGASSRVLLGLAPPLMGSAIIDVSGWWRRDVSILLTERSSNERGKNLLWLEPWADGTQIPFQLLDPLFIEICRRVRLDRDRRSLLLAWITPVLKPRINVSDWVGNSGDPWAPLTADTGEALTLGERDFDYRLLVDLLIGSDGGNTVLWKLPKLATPIDEEKEKTMLLVATAFARGKGGKTRTDGFRWRVIPLPKAMVRKLLFTEPVGAADLVLQDIDRVLKSLIHALRLVASSGDPEKLASTMKSQSARNKLDNYVAPARAALRRQADELFFPELWRRMEVTADAGFTPLRLAFLESLSRIARKEFVRALPAIPCASLMRPRAETRGRQKLEDGLNDAIRELREQKVADVEP